MDHSKPRNVEAVSTLEAQQAELRPGLVLEALEPGQGQEPELEVQDKGRRDPAMISALDLQAPRHDLGDLDEVSSAIEQLRVDCSEAGDEDLVLPLPPSEARALVLPLQEEPVRASH